MKSDRYLFDGSPPCALRKLPCDSKDDHVKKEDILAKTAENLEKMAALQDAFYADGREGLVIILQALDAAGKDSTVKHVMGGLNPQGVQVTRFKQPTSEELRHDFLWRVNKVLPPRGSIAIFNRSYYEDKHTNYEDLFRMAKAFGVTTDEVLAHLDDGCSEEEIEEKLYDPTLLHEMTGELLYAY